MSKLHNDFTTPEQSKQLLELGVPADSANYWICIDKSDFTYTIKVFHSHNYSYIENYYNEMNRKEEMYIDILPCWSVGRLMEIYTICYDLDYIEFDTFADGTNFLKQILDRFENCIDSMDFSKLEK